MKKKRWVVGENCGAEEKNAFVMKIGARGHVEKEGRKAAGGGALWGKEAEDGKERRVIMKMGERVRMKMEVEKVRRRKGEKYKGEKAQNQGHEQKAVYI